MGWSHDENAMRPAKYSFLPVAFAALLLPVVVPAAFASPFSKYAGIYSFVPPDTAEPTGPEGPAFSVSLGPDGTATVTQDSGKGAITSFGHWNDAGSQITVKFDEVEGKPTDPPMVFQPAHDGLQVVTWDHNFWGKVTPPALKKEESNWHANKKHHI